LDCELKMSQTYRLGSSVKVEQLQEELSAQIQALRTEIEDNEMLQNISSKPYRYSGNLVHPKIKMLSLLIHRHVFQNLNFFLLLKGIVHFEIIFLICFSLSRGHPRCRCLCFHSIFNFDILRSNRSCLAVIKWIWSPPQRARTEKSKLNMI